jgi:spoIIIJ-associated protein
MKKEFIGRTVEDAIQNGLAELGVSRDAVDIEVLDEGSRGLFGLFGFKMARVSLDAPDVEPAVPAPQPADEIPAPAPERQTPPEEDVEDDFVATQTDALSEEARRVLDFLTETAQLMGVRDPGVALAEDEENIRIRIAGEKVGRMIGHRGETLDALQLLSGLVANHHRGQTVEPYRRVSLDIGNYRREREATLEQLARRLAQKARRSGHSVSLEPMNSFERRIIHSALADMPGIATHSEGEEPNRHVVISAE